MLSSAIRNISSLVGKRNPWYYCACWKSTAADPVIAGLENAKDFKDMPGPRGIYSIPKIGLAFFLKPFGKHSTLTLYKLLDALHEKYGPTFRLELFGPSVITSSPDAIETLFKNEGKYPQRMNSNLLETYIERNSKERGIGVIDGPEWHRLRSATQKYMLKINSASIYIGAQVAVANDLITRISTMTYTPEEFRDELFKYATESIAVVCFNKRLGFMDPKNAPTPETTRYLDAINQFFKLMIKEIGSPPLFKIFPTKLYKDFEKATDYIYGFGGALLNEVLTKAKRQMEDGSFDPEEPNLILRLNANLKTTVEGVNGILLDLLSAGTDSTAKNMEMFLLILALNPEKQQKLYDEILEVIGPKGKEMEAEHISKMVYFRACMKESFRLHFPVLTGTLRLLPQDAVIDGYLIPKGRFIRLPSYRLALEVGAVSVGDLLNKNSG